MGTYIGHNTHVEVKWQLTFFHHVGPRNQIQIARLGGKYFYLLRHLVSPPILYHHHMLFLTYLMCTQLRSSLLGYTAHYCGW